MKFVTKKRTVVLLKKLLVLVIVPFVYSFQEPLFPESGVVFSFSSYESLVFTKQKIEQEDAKALKDYDRLMQRADSALDSRIFSVCNKTSLPASGNVHDYYSIAPYFWPNTETPDSLPYVRRDGEVNPGARTESTDFSEKEQFFNAISNLGTAYFYSEDEKYAQKAIQLLNAWFIDTATFVNPHLNYAQGIPGINEGRCLGIIEFGGIGKVVTTLEILKLGHVLPVELASGIDDWLSQYFDWLKNSEFGMMEASRINNHGTHYDGQLCGFLCYLNRDADVANYLETVVKKRIAYQIEPDGSQPHELVRTKAFTYSAMNLRGLTRLAQYGKRVGVDLWGYETEDGRSIKQGYVYLASYLRDNKEWDYKQITKGDYYAHFAKDLLLTAKNFNEPALIKIAEDYLQSKTNK